MIAEFAPLPPLELSVEIKAADAPSKQVRAHVAQAQEALDADALLGRLSVASSRAFLSNVSRIEADHDAETCGTCHQRTIWAQVARELIEQGLEEEAVVRWSEEVHARWQSSKFARLDREEQAAGRDPRAAFAERGWQP